MSNTGKKKKERNKNKLPVQSKMMEGLKSFLFDEFTSTNNDKLTIKDHWQKIDFQVDGVNVEIPCHYRPAKNANAVIGLCTGMKASTASYRNIIRGLNDRGFDVVAINLPYPESMGEQSDEFYDIYKKIMKGFMTDPDSPVYQIARREEVPVFSLTHSTGGLLFTDLLLHDADFRNFVDEHTIGAIHMCPFFEAANASRDHNKNLGKVFKYHAKNNPDKVLGDSILEVPYLFLIWLLGTRTLTHRDVLPKYKQIRTLIENGERVVDAVRGGLTLNRYPQCFIVSENDPMSCYKTSKYVASKLPATTRKTKGFHDPLEGNIELLDQLAGELTKQTQSHKDVTLPSSDVVCKDGQCFKKNPETSEIEEVPSIEHEETPQKKRSGLARLFRFGGKTKEQDNDTAEQSSSDNEEPTPKKVKKSAIFPDKKL